MLTVGCMVRARSLVSRLSQVLKMKQERKEVQTVEYLRRIKIFTREKIVKKNNAPVEKQGGPKKKITNLNKNIMSVLLPYLTQPEILRFEACSKQTAVFANHWPVWKNVFCELHLIRNKHRLPEEERHLQGDEEYRAACKRCFIYIRSNRSEEDDAVEPALADYYKGESFVIIEEFLLSLSELPEAVSSFPYKPIDYVNSKLALTAESMNTWLDKSRSMRTVKSLNLMKKSAFQCLIPQLPYSTTVDNYDAHVGEEALKIVPTHAYVSLVKAYVYIEDMIKKVTIYLMLKFFTLISAGPVGNLITRTVPRQDSEYRLSIILYLIQFILSPLLLALLFHPILLFVSLLLARLYQCFWLLAPPSPYQPSDLIFIPLAVATIDISFCYYNEAQS
jgi:hypothetical protein